MQASGLNGPIPYGISLLSKVKQLRMADISGAAQRFPDLSNMTGLVKLVLRNCNIVGEIPRHMWKMSSLIMLDVSFNHLVGEFPDHLSAKYLQFIFLTGNNFSGDLPRSVMTGGRNIDLSYNNFTWQGPEKPTCEKNLNLNLNLFRSSSSNDSLKDLLPCSNSVQCPRYACSVHINCGGDDITISENNGKFLYEGDVSVRCGAATNFRNPNSYWGFSSTGDYMDDNNFQDLHYVKSLTNSSLSELYATARVAPISLTYYAYCLENGNYTVKLHFAEIQFINDKTDRSLGRRFFDIYIQDKLVQKDFNIEDEAHGAETPLVKVFNSSVTSNFIEIRFQWVGRGTTRIPSRGVYGPLISAISVYPNFKKCPNKRKSSAVYVSVGLISFITILLTFGILWWKCCFKRGISKYDLGELQLQAGGYTLNQIKEATDNFSPTNKIGEGGFGPVYKGLLPNGTLIAVKQLASKSKQGNREFLNEIGMISCLQHPNLVKLHGFCIEKDQLLLVYEFMENNSLARALFGPQQSQNSLVFLDWCTRVKICVGIAKGLAFFHEDSRLKIVHRDIKATNILLDKDFNPKISDFGLARLEDDDKSHVSTRVAGTFGYMAPEYAIWGHLSYKVDVYAYGIVVLETVSGRRNSSSVQNANCFCLLEWACYLQRSGNFVELIDQRLRSSFDIEEAGKLVKVALLCADASPSRRPTMSEVVNMLEGNMEVPDVIPDISVTPNELRFKTFRDIQWQHKQQSPSTQSQSSTTMIPTDVSSSIVTINLTSPHPNNP